MPPAPRPPVRRRRRRTRDYPLPTRGMRYAVLNDVLRRRDIRHATRAGELRVAGHGLYVPASGTAAEHHRAILEALCSDSPHLVSHHTAAALWGILDDDPGPPYHLTTPPELARIKRPGLVVAHRVDVPAADRAMLHGLSITSVARTWVDVALSSSVLDAVIMADRCRRRGRREFGQETPPKSSAAELEAALARRGRARGIARARTALKMSRDRVDSPQETRLRCAMAQAGLPELTEALGWTEVRITREHMHRSGARAVEKIVRALHRQGWPG